MQFKSSLVLCVSWISAAFAQSTTSSTGSPLCAAQNILEACKASIQGQVNSCPTTDYSCLCSAYESMLTCYNNCPNDLGVGSVQQLRTLYCTNASVYGSTSTRVQVATSSSSSGSGSATAAVQSGFSSSTRSGTATAIATTATASSSGASGAGHNVATDKLLLAAVGLILGLATAS